MGLVFLNVFDGHFRLFCQTWWWQLRMAGPVVSPRPLPCLDYDETKISGSGVLWWCPTSIQFNYQNCRRNNWSIIRRLNCQVVNMVLNNVTTSATFDVTRTRHQTAAASICSDVHHNSFELLWNVTFYWSGTSKHRDPGGSAGQIQSKCVPLEC